MTAEDGLEAILGAGLVAGGVFGVMGATEALGTQR